MLEDEIDNHDMDDEEDDEDLPAFNIEELTQQTRDEQGDQSGTIFIRERLIDSLTRIIAFANKDLRPVSFEQCLFKKARLHATNVNMSFEDSLFAENLEFEKAVFTGQINFWETSFDKAAAFSQTVFKGEVSFDECLFSSEADFRKVVFEKRVDFTSCDFEGDVSFDDAKFAARADFSHSTFRGKVSCRHARFENRVDLTNATFAEPPDATGSNLEEARQAVVEEPVQEPLRRPVPKKRQKKAEFNPWRKLDKASKKSMTRRHLLRGLFRFLPEDEKE